MMFKFLFTFAFLLLLFGGLSNIGIAQELTDSIAINVADSIQVAEADTLPELKEEIPIDYILESNTVYNPNIKSILFHRDGWDMSPPLMVLNTDENLKLSFDDLDADYKEYLFTIVHCDANWKPSDLRQNEYIDGYYEDYIYEYDYSFNTVVPYTHYELLFPTQDMQPTLSGNYILKVFLENSDSLIFTRRFMIVKQKVGIEGTVKRATLLQDRNYRQELDFSIKTAGYRIVNPYQDLKIVLQQNGRWDNIITGLKPKMVVSNELNYDYDNENVFDGGNEFRTFDIKSLTYNSEYVKSIKGNYEGYNVYLQDCERKTFTVYKTEDDINGQMKIKTEDQRISETEAEYVNVHIFLPYAAPMMDADMFIIGQLTDWNFYDQSKMEYNYKRKGYEKTMLVKQGYYNYHIILKYYDKMVGDVSFIEGNHFETENQYTIWVYHREPGAYYDQLIGVKHLSSLPE